MSEEFVNPMAGKTAEEKKEFIVGKAMEIIMNSGDARNFAAQAMNAITKGNFDEAKQLLKEADKVIQSKKSKTSELKSLKRKSERNYGKNEQG